MRAGKKRNNERNEMDIEWSMEGVGQTAEARPEERELVPEGTHRLTIIEAQVGPNPHKTHERNPDGICLMLRLELDSRHRWVFHDIPKHQPWQGAQLAEALGLQADGNTLRVSPESVKGKTVLATIEHYVSKAGRTSAIVKRYMAAEQKQRPARTPAAKVKASAPAIGSDDVPF
jgi:hypothetical protein